MPENLFKKIFKDKPRMFVENNLISTFLDNIFLDTRFESRIKFIKQLS